MITYSQEARQTLRNVCRRHEETVVRQFGRAALLEFTEFAAFQALRLRERYGLDVQVERVDPFDASDVPPRVREAARAYEDRDEPSVPYRQFAAGTDYPAPDAMRDGDL